MKIKVVISILIAGLIVTCGLLGLDYNRQRKAKVEITAETSRLFTQLSQNQVPPQDLAQRLTDAQASLATVQSTFPSKPNSTQLINTILRVADECRVKAYPLSTQDWSTDAAHSGVIVFNFGLTITGGYSQFIAFLTRLESGEFETLIINDASITTVHAPNPEDPATSVTTSVLASLDVTFYAQFGTGE